MFRELYRSRIWLFQEWKSWIPAFLPIKSLHHTRVSSTTLRPMEVWYDIWSVDIEGRIVLTLPAFFFSKSGHDVHNPLCRSEGLSAYTFIPFPSTQLNIAIMRMKNMDYTPVSPSNSWIISFAALPRKGSMIFDRRIGQLPLLMGFRLYHRLSFSYVQLCRKQNSDTSYHWHLPLHFPIPVNPFHHSTTYTDP